VTARTLRAVRDGLIGDDLEPDAVEAVFVPIVELTGRTS